MIVKLIKHIKGYILIEVSGFSVERFMNLAMNKNVYLWDVQYNINKVQMKVSIKGFKLLKHCAKKTKCKIKIVKKVGVPFFNFKYRKRKFLFLGPFFCILILYYLSGFVWLININGNEKINSYEIYDFLSTTNIEVGTRKKKYKLKRS